MTESVSNIKEGKFYREIKNNWDAVAKPLDGMGVFEHITALIGQLQHTVSPVTDKNCVVVFCADNGIVEENISQSDQSVTATCAVNIAKKRSSVGIMADSIDADVIAVDIGINTKENLLGVENYKIAYGTKNFLKEPAMSRKELENAIETGRQLVRKCKENGYRMLATGEMGIGNTTTSSAVAAVMLGCDVELVTGRGAGLSDESLKHKRAVIAQAISKYDLNKNDIFEILRTFGGFDIAGMVGMFLEGVAAGMPIVIDGFISMTAALAAKKIDPDSVNCMIASHISKEPGAKLLSDTLALGVNPVINADMALGEGTGAVMMMSLIDTANHVYRESFSFREAGVGQYERYGK